MILSHFVRKILFTILFISFGITTGYARSQKQIHSAKYPYKYVPGEVLVKFISAPSNINPQLFKVNIVSQIDFTKAIPLFPRDQKSSLLKTVRKSNLSKIFKVAIDENTNIPLICAQLESSGLVEYAEPNYLLPVEEVPNDSLWDEMWHLRQVQAPAAWDISKGDSSITIAIIDTGVDWDHPDLVNSIWSNADEVLDGTDTDGNGYVDDIRGWDFVERVLDYKAGEDGIMEDNNPMDFDGHGTFVAGIAGVSTNNHIGTSSLSWGCKIMPLRAGYNSFSGGYIVLEYAAKAFRYAADNGADIINLSTASSQVLVDAARYAYDKGVVITKSAGNDRSADPDPLELEPFVLSTAAVNASDEKAGYSDFGRWVKISAPGGEYNNGGGLRGPFFDDHYRIQQGTSYAAPNVAALAGLIKSHQPGLSASDIIFQITETADDIDFLNPAYAGLLGSGRINAYRALTELANPQPELFFSSIVVDDIAGGNGDGRINNDEQINLAIGLTNFWGDAENLTAVLQTDSPHLTIEKSIGRYDFIAGISDMLNNSATNTNETFAVRVKNNVLPQMIPMGLTLSNTNGYNQSIALSLPVNPSILLVDDDGNEDFEKYYKSALKELNCAYEEWNVFTNGPPSTILEKYDTVIWFCGLTGDGIATLTAANRAALSTFLDNGGQLFLSGQDIGWDLCEADVADNQFSISNGESKIFYENYLHAKYIKDDVNKRNVTGFPGDPISDFISLTINTPSNGFEYPSEIAALGPALPIFKYSAGEIAAIRYAGDSRLVYCAFGGIESIVEKDQRVKLLGRVLQWLNGITIHHNPLQNTDDTQSDYVVSAYIEQGIKELKNTFIFWKLIGDETFQIINLENSGQNMFTANIPAQSEGTVQYGIVLKFVDDTFVPFLFHSFKIIPDTSPPKIVSVLGPDSPFRKSQLLFSTTVTDDLHQDALIVQMDYSTVDGRENQVEMNTAENDSVFSVVLDENFNYGDTLYYTISANDGSPNQNKSTLKDTAIVGYETFENGIGDWSVESGSWGLDYTQKKSGTYSLNDSPQSEINAGVVSIVHLSFPLDFSVSKKASLAFWSKTSLRDKKDIGYVEASIDGSNWSSLLTIRGTTTAWKHYNIDLSQYAGSDSVFLRFRLVTNNDLTLDATGWYIDNLQVLEKTIETGTGPLERKVPGEFYLSQNYPNPFNPTTRIEFGLSTSDYAEINIYNTLGQFIKQLTNRHYAAGRYSVNWNAKDYAGNNVPAGLYYLRFKVGGFVQVRKIAFVK